MRKPNHAHPPAGRAGLTSHISHPDRYVLVLVGPTASGKTALSLLISNQLSVEIISADSRQIYKLMDIGTSKPSTEDRSKVKHHLVDELMPDQDFNAGEFGRRGREIIDEIFQQGKTPLIVGGSGLYVQSLVDGFFEGHSADPELRSELYRRMKIEGAEKLLDELRAVDPQSASKMLPSNTRRIVRALEIYRLTGIPISQMHRQRVEINFTPVFVGLRWNRARLYDRINRRVDAMIEQGLVYEVRKLREMGYSSDLNAFQTPGYVEVFEFLDGKIDHDRMVYLIKRNTRWYAKRQFTWFRPDNRIRWFDVESEEVFPTVAEEIMDQFCSVTDGKVF